MDQGQSMRLRFECGEAADILAGCSGKPMYFTFDDVEDWGRSADVKTMWLCVCLTLQLSFIVLAPSYCSISSSLTVLITCV